MRLLLEEPGRLEAERAALRARQKTYQGFSRDDLVPGAGGSSDAAAAATSNGGYRSAGVGGGYAAPAAPLSAGQVRSCLGGVRGQQQVAGASWVCCIAKPTWSVVRVCSKTAAWCWLQHRQLREEEPAPPVQAEQGPARAPASSAPRRASEGSAFPAYQPPPAGVPGSR